MIRTARLVFATLALIRRAACDRNGSRLKRALVFGGMLYVVLLPFNLIWPYGGSRVLLPG